MEVLLSGDFLSSTIFAYVYKDAIRGLAAIVGRAGIPLPDRAAVLEAAWEDHYCKYTSGACCNGTGCAESDFKGMSRLFLSVAGFKPQDKWFPLLFFNTTDVDTGRRVIVSSVAPKTCVRDGTETNCVCDETLDGTHKCNLERLLPDAYDLHQLLADQPGDEGREMDKQGAHLPAGRLPRDLRLSTAAGLSARFPFVSPVGNVTNNDKRLVARVVDGGYFENFGAATAYDIAYRLQELKLDPLIIEITNDPELFGALVVTPPKDQDPPSADGDLCNIDFRDPVCAPEPAVIQVNGDYFFSGIRGPLSGLFGGRNAQGGRALWQLANISGKKKNGCLPSEILETGISCIFTSIRNTCTPRQSRLA